MEPGHLANNLALLEKRDSSLAESLRSLKPTGMYIAEPSRAGPPALIHILSDGTRKTLHSIYDPLREASKFIDTINLEESANYVITGFGLGYHILEACRRISPHSRLIVIEKNLELFLLALTHFDFAPLFALSGATFHIGVKPAEIEYSLSADKTAFALNGYTTIAFKPLIDDEIAYYHAINKGLERFFQEERIDFNTQAAFSKYFYNNIIDNLPSILESAGINPLKNGLPNVPAIIISAGPSLDKNINLLKNLGDNAVLIAVATALKPLLSNGIEPDFVVAIDPDEALLKAFDLEKAPQKTWLLFDPCVQPLIPECFESRKLAFDSNIFLSQWIARYNGEKGSLGKMQSVAHTALKFAQHLGCKPIILAGQDLAFSQYRMHCKGSYFHETLQDAITRLATMNYLQKQNYLIYSRALATAPDVFGNTATTTAAMRSYNRLFADEINDSVEIYNATEGGIPISSIQNICLGEMLNKHCREHAHAIKQAFLREIKVVTETGKLGSALIAKAGTLEQLNRNLVELSVGLKNTGEGKTNHAQFVSDMENIYKTLVQDSDTIQLLQGYAYSGFLEWNKSNNEINRRSHACQKPELLELKFDRDIRFIEILTEASDFLGKAFEKMARQASQHPMQ